VAEVSVPDYGLPSSSQATAEHEGRGWVSQMVTQSLTPRPVPKRERCTACGTCVRSCPQDAITIVDRLAVVDQKSCIRCYCCHEVCPEAAIDLELSLLGRLLRLVGMLG
jgi:ferredoxin